MKNQAIQLEMIAAWEAYRASELRLRKAFTFMGFGLGFLTASIFWTVFHLL